jgi:Arc/MetJ-type ribon-helix-helix transcriptional regulator
MSMENLSEKVSVNINSSTLSNIDLLVDNGYYSNRSDFINQSLRESIQKHQSTLDRIIEKNESVSQKNSDFWFIGVGSLNAEDIEDFYQSGRKMKVSGYGVLVIEDYVEDEKLFNVVESITVKGKVVCKASIKSHYGIK